jgi:transcriptional regulator with XRE-family HTH domain
MAQYPDHTAIAQTLLDQQADINRLTEERDGAYRGGRKSIPIGPTGQVVAENVARLRKSRGWTLRALSKALAAAGRDLGQDAINKIENGRREEVTTNSVSRRIDVDDLVAFAAVFGVAPAVLLTNPRCAACLDSPPPGFACTTCGSKTPRAQST